MYTDKETILVALTASLITALLLTALVFAYFEGKKADAEWERMNYVEEQQN